MLAVSFLELIVRGVPESFLFVYSVYILSNTKFNKKLYFLTSTILVVVTFFIRRLPISYGIHTILNIILLVILTTYIDKINILKSIKAGIITAIIMFICEGINMFFIQCLCGNNIIRIFTNPTLKTIYGLPSLIIFFVVILIIKFLLYKKEEK
ncbi:hypothetical protein J2Z53_000292 [Clostridium moniliforme]|uniref:CPBP family intramembrane metalloprotease n=1 Tax=Clostridium moniliforme TaxID=39489 RepID=A0ABS4EXJ6_9CLOT|nr:hypothetical protein [Clostridium moniliforme]MBP1888713.1 hypothetical protein [Clostridium moniliforme]